MFKQKQLLHCILKTLQVRNDHKEIKVNAAVPMLSELYRYCLCLPRPATERRRSPASAAVSLSVSLVVVVVVVVTRSDQPKPPAVAIVRQNGLSSASCRASVAVTPVSRQIWWIQVVGGRPLARLHSCEGWSPSLVLVQIRRIWFADTSLRSLAT